MDDLVETITRGNVAEVKVLLASIALGLAVYQLFLIAVAYGKLRHGFLDAPPAATAHRAAGDTIALVMVAIGVMCLSEYGFDEGGAHPILASALLAVLATKIAVVRRDFGLGRFLPLLGISVFLLLAMTWATSAGGFLGGES